MMLDLENGFQLTEFRSSDRDALVEHLSNREIHRRTLRLPYPYTAADAEKWFAFVAESTKQFGQPVHWAIRGPARNLIGGVGLEGLSADQSHRAEIGYWLAEPFWGRGIATSAVRAVCRYAFDTFGLEKITAQVFDGNDASCRVLEKCGFHQEGFLQKHLVKDGKMLDVKAYGRLR